MNEEIKGRLEQIRRGEIPDGYKRTRAGIIPNNWKVTRLRDSGRKCLKKNTDFKIRLVFSNSAQNGIIPQEEQFDKSIANKEHIDGYYIVNPGDFVYNPRISVTAPCGPINRNETGETGIVSPLYTVFTVDFPKADNAYLKHYFKSSHWFQYMKGVANYGVRHDRMNISDADFFAMPFPTPTIAEQQKIAEILSTQDSVIELKERLVTEKLRQKKYLMQRLLTGKQRLPGFHGRWNAHSLCDITERRTTRNIAQCDRVLTISGQYGLIEQWSFFDKTVASADKSNYFFLERDDFAYNKSRSTGYPFGAIKRLKKYDTGIVSPLYICFRISSQLVTAEYMEHYFEANLINQEIKFIAQEGARNHGLLNIGVDDFFNLKVYLPPVDEQMAIADILSAADREIELLRASLEQEKRKKKALSQLLLTGIVRV